MTLTARSVLSALCGPEKVSPQPVKCQMPALPPAQFGKIPGSLLLLQSLQERSTKVPSGAWEAPKLDFRVRHSLSSPARPLCRPTTPQPWCPRTSTWLTTGWRMIWKKSSQRKRGGSAWTRMKLEERTLFHLQQQGVRTGAATQTLSPEVIRLLFEFFIMSNVQLLCVLMLSVYCRYFSVQQESLCAKEQFWDASPSQNDSDTRNG